MSAVHAHDALHHPIRRRVLMSALLVWWWWLQYPYLPAHCSKPKEQAKVFLIQLPDKCGFHLPANLALNAVRVAMVLLCT